MEPNANYSTQKTTRPSGFWGAVMEWIRVIIIALLISLPIRYFIVEPFIVNGASMDPTFATNQFLLVDRLSYRFEAPARGDVIVFEYPNNPSIYYIKRIIGLPGETLSVTDGKVSIVNSASTSQIASTSIASSTGLSTSTSLTLLKEPYVEDIHTAHDTFTVTLKPTEYFVMGDNRAESSDSRVWGPLDRHFIVGRPIVRLLPVATISVLPGEYRQ